MNRLPSAGVQRDELAPSGSSQALEGPSAQQIRLAAEAGVRTPSSPLPYLDQLRASFTGYDLGGIRAHRGSEATASAGAMGAAAYATGHDVVFAGEPSLHTVAHEVTHVLQQQRGVQLEGGVGQVGDAYEQHADVVADRVSAGLPATPLLTPGRHARPSSDAAPSSRVSGGDEAVASSQSGIASPDRPSAHEEGTGPRAERAVTADSSSTSVQRLVTRRDFELLAGPATARSSTYTRILKKLASYEQADADTGPLILMQLQNLIETWLEAHLTSTSARDIWRKEYMDGLLEEVKHERDATHRVDTRYISPTAQTEKRADEVTRARTAREEHHTLAEDAHTKFKFTVVASVEHEDYGRFARTRMHKTAWDRVGRASKRKTTAELKRAAATEVIEEKDRARPRGEKLTPKDKREQVEQLLGSGVGHTFIIFSQDGADGTRLSSQSFGFYPLRPFRSPTAACAGKVESPDHAEAKASATVRRRETVVTRERYGAGLDRAFELMSSPPSYTLLGYNCTTFAKDVSNSVRTPFPGDAYMAVPYEFAMAYNPNDLYDKLEADADG